MSEDTELGRMRKKIVITDFDGTITQSDLWPHIGGVVPNIQAYMQRILDLGYQNEILSSRWSGGDARKAVEEVYGFLKEQDIPFTRINWAQKPGAAFYIDDRALNPKIMGWQKVLEYLKRGEI